MTRPTVATISRAALRHNATLAREIAGNARVMAVVKADAYGHGAAEVARTLAGQVDALAVAALEEAIELREAGIDSPILLLEGVFARDELDLAAEQRLWVTVENTRQLEMLTTAQLASPVTCWLKTDTGMHRLGLPPQEVPAAHAQLCAAASVAGDVVLFTHFADAETVGSEVTRRQLERFDAIELAAPRSACNSAGLLNLPQAHHDWVRPGYLLYGNSPLTAPNQQTDALRPAMTLHSQVSSVRTIEPGESVGYGGTWVASRRSTIATVPIGYGDGYPRGAPAGTPVLVDGRRAPLAGRVSMDMITVDVTDLPPPAIGSPVVLWGTDLALHEIADHVGTNGYELTTRMPRRTPRVFTDD